MSHQHVTSFAEIQERHVNSLVAKWQATNVNKQPKHHFHNYCIICDKTGNLVQQNRNGNKTNINDVAAVHGQERANTIKNMPTCPSVDLIWLFTDSKALRQLLIHDPVGYYVYAISFVFDIVSTSIGNIIFKAKLNQALQETLQNDKSYIKDIYYTNEWLRRTLVILTDKQIQSSGANPPLQVKYYLPETILEHIKKRLKIAITQTKLATKKTGITLGTVSSLQYGQVPRHRAFTRNSSKGAYQDYDTTEIMLAFNEIFNNPELIAKTDMQIRKFNAHMEQHKGQTKRERKVNTVDLDKPVTLSFGSPV